MKKLLSAIPVLVLIVFCVCLELFTTPERAYELGQTFAVPFSVLLIYVIFWTVYHLKPKDKVKVSGRDYEYLVAKKLKKSGFKGVKVTKGSGDYGVDIIARKHGKKIAIQCKHYKGSVGVDAVQEVYSGKGFYDCDVAMVITNSCFTPAAKTLARKNGVKLVDKYDSSWVDRIEELSAILD